MEKLKNRTTLCNGTVHDNVVMAARQKDRAILTTSLNCMAAAASLSRAEEALVYRNTGGCFKMLQAGVFEILHEYDVSDDQLWFSVAYYECSLQIFRFPFSCL